jgi:hypothetical protein
MLATGLHFNFPEINFPSLTKGLECWCPVLPHTSSMHMASEVAKFEECLKDPCRSFPGCTNGSGMWEQCLGEDCDRYRSRGTPLKGLGLDGRGRIRSVVRLPFWVLISDHWLGISSATSLHSPSVETVVAELEGFVADLAANKGKSVSIGDLKSSISTESHAVVERYASSSPSPFGINLFTAIETHCRFVHKTTDLSWGSMKIACTTLDLAISRYGKFVSLSNRYPQQPVTPTWDIDLVWHTHQLFPSAYHSDNYAETGRVPDHDIKRIEPEESLERRVTTSKLWQAEFGEHIAICLCYECVVKRNGFKD